MEKLVSMKKLVSLGLVFVLAAVFAISAFAAPADAEEIVPLSRGSYYLTSGYTTIASVSTGLGTSSIEVYNLAENGAGIWVRIGSNEQGIHMGSSAGWTMVLIRFRPRLLMDQLGHMPSKLMLPPN